MKNGSKAGLAKPIAKAIREPKQHTPNPSHDGSKSHPGYDREKCKGCASALLPGDILFTKARAGGWISDLIGWWTRTWGEPPTRASHVALVVEPAEHTDDTLLIEQTWPRQRKAVLGTYAGADVFIYRRVGMPNSQRKSIVDQAWSDLGRRYGAGKLLLFLADAALGKIISLPIYLLGRLFGRKWRGIEMPIFTRLDITKDLVCSQTVARYYWNSGYHFDGHWLTRNPDNMLDYCESHSSQFKLVLQK